MRKGIWQKRNPQSFFWNKNEQLFFSRNSNSTKTGKNVKAPEKIGVPAELAQLWLNFAPHDNSSTFNSAKVQPRCEGIFVSAKGGKYQQKLGRMKGGGGGQISGIFVTHSDLKIIPEWPECLNMTFFLSTESSFVQEVSRELIFQS